MFSTPTSLEPRFQNLCDNNIPRPAQTSADATAATSNVHASQTPSSDRSPAHQASRKNTQSLRQRINCLVVKTLAENQEKDKLNNLQQVATPAASPTPTNAATNVATAKPQSAATPVAQSTSVAAGAGGGLFHGDTWKIKILQNTRVITTVQESQFVCNALAKNPTSDDGAPVVISVDCEGINIGVKGQLTLIEVSTVAC